MREAARLNRLAAAFTAATAFLFALSTLLLVAEQRYEEALRRLGPLPPEFEKAGEWARAANTYFWMGYCNEKEGRIPLAIDF